MLRSLTMTIGSAGIFLSREGLTEFLGQFFRVLNSGDLNVREQTFAVEVEQLS